MDIGALGLELRGLKTGYRVGKSLRIVSKCLDAGLPQGSLTMVLGPNGSGKSTLMHTIAGLLPALSGEVLIEGTALSSLSTQARAKHLSLVLTERITSESMTVRELVRIGRYPYVGYMAKLSAQDEDIVLNALCRCRLDGLVDRPLLALSDGERQRAMIARALAQDTPLILLDEPTAHLDLPSRIESILMLRELAQQTHRTILLSTHELDLALQWSDNIWLINREGRLFSGSPQEVVEGDYLEKTFGNEWLTYDKERRAFVVRYRS